MNQDLDPTQNTRDWIETKLNALRSEMRTLFILSVAGNQLLSHISLSAPAVAIGTIAILGGGAAIKGLAALLL